MNAGRHLAPKIMCLALLSLALPVAVASPTVSKAELARCTGIDAADERLACYDALAGRRPSHAQPPPPAATSQAAPVDAKSFGLTKPVPQVESHRL